jgi:ABC-type branched-subunit amino acid transport system substrate-binding protein
VKPEAALPTRGQFVTGGLAASAATLASINVIAAPTQALVVGIVVPQTGAYSAQGLDQLKAYRMAIAEINAAGGVLGMPLQASIGDDRTRPASAVQHARRMIEGERAVMITGGSSSATAVAVSDLCQQKDVIFMAALTHSNETTGASCHAHTFRRYINAHMSAGALARTMLTKYGSGRWFYITADYTWGHSVYESITEVVEPKGAKTIKNVLVPVGSSDFGSAFTYALAAKPDVLVISEFGNDMVNALYQAAQFGFTKTTKILVPLADEYMVAGVGDSFDGVVTTAPFYWQYHAARYPAAKKFVDDFIKLYGTPPSNGAECAYTNMFEWKAGVERAGSPSPKKFVAKMEGHHFQATKDPEYWRGFDHQGINSVLVLEGIPPEQRTNKYAYAKVLEVHEGDSVASKQSASDCKLDPA